MSTQANTGKYPTRETIMEIARKMFEERYKAVETLADGLTISRIPTVTIIPVAHGKTADFGRKP